MSRFLLFVVAVVVAGLAVTVKSEVDHRCKFIERQVRNCTRWVYVPCAEGETSSSSSSSSSSQTSDVQESSQNEEGEAPLSRRRRSLEEFLGNIIRRFFNDGDDDEDDSQWCKKEETFQCIMYRCYIGCCPGWKWNATSETCSIRDNRPPGIECFNGGTPTIGPNGWRCECPSMYTGEHCGEALCKLECMNNGMCDMYRGRPTCVCPDNFNGSRCEQPVCKGGCSGHGECIVEDGRTRCRCEHEYRGRNCQHLIPEKEKEGDCPPVTSSTQGTCEETCQTDSGCPLRMKCCFNGCGHMCMQPANYTCYHAGTNYRIGEVFYPDKCNVCTCLNPDTEKAFGGAQCRKPVCPELNNCQDIREDPDICCPYCADVVKPDPEYTEPKFNNCPRSIVTIDVGKDTNEAGLPFTLVAVDFRDQKLEVTLTRESFQAGLGEQNFDTVIATSERDEMGKYAYCEFHVRIRDMHAPNFTFCPSDIFLPEAGRAEWDEPKARDNVGLIHEPSASFKSGDHFPRGEHVVVYSVEDLEGNMARCSFFVRVGHHDEFGGMDGRHHHHHKEHERKRNIMFISIGVAVFFFIIVLVLVAYLCRRCRRVPRNAAAANTNPPAYDNNIYNIGATMPPPPYKEKPPVYMNETEEVPEKKKKMEEEEERKYEELPVEKTEDKAPLDADDVDLKMGVDNPTYRL